MFCAFAVLSSSSSFSARCAIVSVHFACKCEISRCVGNIHENQKESMPTESTSESIANIRALRWRHMCNKVSCNCLGDGKIGANDFHDRNSCCFVFSHRHTKSDKVRTRGGTKRGRKNKKIANRKFNRPQISRAQHLVMEIARNGVTKYLCLHARKHSALTRDCQQRILFEYLPFKIWHYY